MKNLIKEIVQRKRRKRYFLIKGFKVLDIMNPYLIDRKSIYEFVVNSIKIFEWNKGKILDLGCGSKPYKKIIENKDNIYIGMDVKVSGNRDDSKSVDVYYDGCHFPFDNNSFKSIISTQVLEHVLHIDDVLSECSRVLEENGLMIISIPLCYEEHEMPYDFRRFTTSGIQEMLKKHSFSILELYKSTSYKDTLRQLKATYIVNKYNQKKAVYMEYMGCLELQL